METDTYKTLDTPSTEILFKEKKSKFFGYAFPIENEDDVKTIIEDLRKMHHTANHVCYAWQLGVEQIRYRANDDGEPNNSAGMPIYGQIQSFGVTNVLVAVARIFGGTKLGVGGLISAYKTAAQMTLDTAVIVEKTLKQEFVLHFDYPEMDKVMRTIKQQQLEIISQEMTMKCKIRLSVRKQDAPRVEKIFSLMHPVKIVQDT
ncbi:YigZ family protein [Arenibacter sp. 6A1]|uniref:IMPACT family protein n=1 Tax=Arenibacter sp. 6A1 TaxID=2720391 RepID=UPI0014483278|nr:YigZ family protein [Arenibacter sp. 6A1]NKI25963.1 YigZ family protein [Arenibacter sp. 6A1]